MYLIIAIPLRAVEIFWEIMVQELILVVHLVVRGEHSSNIATSANFLNIIHAQGVPIKYYAVAAY